MKRINITIILIFSILLSWAQNHPIFTLDIRFEGGPATWVDGELIALNKVYRLVKFETSCEFEEVDYKFQKNDTILLRYFRELETCFMQPEFYVNMNNSWEKPENGHYYIYDGIITSFRFKSDSVDIDFTAKDRICILNSLYDKILDSFFNIAMKISHQKNLNVDMSQVDISLLTKIEANSCSSPIRLVCYDPLTYRLRGRVDGYTNNYVLNLLNSLPGEKPTYIEVSSDYYINQYDAFYLLFKKFLKTATKIIWIPDNDIIGGELKKLGVKKKHMMKAKHSE